MARVIYLEVPVTITSEDQATKLLNAVNSGLAEIAIKDRVLYGGSAPVAPAPSTPVSFANSEAKAEEASIKLKSVETARPGKGFQIQTEAPKERARGVIGRKRMERTGRS